MEIPVVYYAERSSKELQLIWASISDHGIWTISYGIDESEFLNSIYDRGPCQAIYDENHCTEILNQIEAYLAGTLHAFDLRIDWRGMTKFQIAVRKAVMALPYGTTASYGEIAADVGNPRAARAVGAVQADNPISFVIPCHRVIGADGSLHGYGGFGGLNTKAWLIDLEAASLR